MANPFILIWFGLFTLLMAIPFCIATIYAIISVRQWMVGDKENSDEKRTGARKALMISLVAMLLVFFAYLILLELFF